MNRPVPSTLSVRVPFAIRKRGGRKLVITPDGRTERPRSRLDSALVEALARAHRWQRMHASGECGSITELAAAEKIDRSYLCRGLRLTLLAPEIVEAIMDGRQAEGLTLPALMKGLPVEWAVQLADDEILIVLRNTSRGRLTSSPAYVNAAMSEFAGAKLAPPLVLTLPPLCPRL